MSKKGKEPAGLRRYRLAHKRKKTGKAKRRHKRKRIARPKKRKHHKRKRVGAKVRHVLVLRPRKRRHKRKHVGKARKRHKRRGHRMAGPKTGGSFFAAHSKLV